MMDDLYEKTDELLKSLLSIKTGAPKNQSIVPAAIKTTMPAVKLPKKLPDSPKVKLPKGPSAPKVAKPSIKFKSPTEAAEQNKIAGGLPPASKKDPKKIAEQLKNPNPKALVKPQEEVLKVAHNGQWSLEKKELDPSHGITFQHEHHDLGGVGDLTHIKAIHPVHGVVGETVLEHQADGSLKPSDVTVAPSHRRMGIASAMYSHGQSVTGKTIKPSTAQTDLGAALWAGNKTKPQFG